MAPVALTASTAAICSATLAKSLRRFAASASSVAITPESINWPRSRSTERRRSANTASSPRARPRSCSMRTNSSLTPESPRADNCASAAMTVVSKDDNFARNPRSASSPANLSLARLVNRALKLCNSRPARNICSERISPMSAPCLRADSAWRSSGRKLRRTSRNKSWARIKLASVPSRRRSAFSLRLRCLSTPAASSIIPRRSSGRALSTASICPWLTITCC